MIGKRYELEQEIGAGGMGTVYRAKDSQTGQTVAVKQLKPELATPELLERFQREGEALRELNHPNIVKMLDMVEENGSHYLVLEYIQGGDLAHLLKDKAMPLEKILSLAIDLADALTRAHKLAIVHRDLKPANVLIAEDGTVRLTDFGVAQIRQKKRVTETGAAVGTLDYLSPEALKGGEVDSRADIWSFGVLLFEMLTGERPFSAETVGETLMKILMETVPDLEELRPDIPLACADLVYRMLEKDPQARIPSVRIVGAELEAILQGRATQSFKPAVVEKRFEAVQTTGKIVLTPHNLPAQTSPFVGRENELQELSRLLDKPDVRLVTIIAQGGMGKTRLSLELAGRYLENQYSSTSTHFEQGVYCIELAPLSEAASIIPVIAEVMNYPFQQDGREQKQQVLDFLQAKKCLLVFDNFEHILAGASLVTEILKAAPQVKIIVTSRQKLNQSGENVFILSGMDFPQWETPSDALNYAAVKLFMQSATRVKADFVLDEQNLPAVAQICRLVQGLPLGIVLAAAWLAMLSPEEIAHEMQASIDFLETDMGDIPERQRSIRAVFDYSWNLMSADEQGVFMKLALFRGGFTREAAQAVADANLRVLMSLVNKSLLRRDADSGRYHIHELLRQYAQERCEASGQVPVVQARFAAYYADWMLQAAKGIKSQAQMETLKALDADFENVHMAWQYGIDKRDEKAIDSLLEGLMLYCQHRNRFEEAKHLLAPARQIWQLDNPNPSALAVALQLYFPQSDDLVALYTACLALAEKHQQALLIAHCERWLGFELGHRHYKVTEGLAYQERSLQHYQAIGEFYYAAYLLDEMGWCYFLLGAHEKRIEAVQKSLDLHRQVGNAFGECDALRGLANTFYAYGQFSKVVELLEAAYAISKRIQDTLNILWSGETLNYHYFNLGEFDKARIFAYEAFDLANTINHIVLKCLIRLIIAFDKAVALNQAEIAVTEVLQAAPDDLSFYQTQDFTLSHLGTLIYSVVMVNAGYFEKALAFSIHGVKTLAGVQNVPALSLHLSPATLILVHLNEHEKALETMAFLETNPLCDTLWLKKWHVYQAARQALVEHFSPQEFERIWQTGQQKEYQVLSQEVLALLGANLQTGA